MCEQGLQVSAPVGAFLLKELLFLSLWISQNTIILRSSPALNTIIFVVRGFVVTLATVTGRVGCLLQVSLAYTPVIQMELLQHSAKQGRYSRPRKVLAFEKKPNSCLAVIFYENCKVCIEKNHKCNGWKYDSATQNRVKCVSNQRVLPERHCDTHLLPGQSLQKHLFPVRYPHLGHQEEATEFDEVQRTAISSWFFKLGHRKLQQRDGKIL